MHYTSKPSEMHLGCLDKNGGVSKQMKELWTPVAETYTADIASFQTFVPGVAATHTIVANQNAINAYLLQVKLELQEDIASKKDMSFWVQKAQDNGFVQKIIYKELIEHML